MLYIAREPEEDAERGEIEATLWMLGRVGAAKDADNAVIGIFGGGFQVFQRDCSTWIGQVPRLACRMNLFYSI